MAASPQSTVSSDLYSLVEPAPGKVRPQDGAYQEDSNQSTIDDPFVDVEESEYSDTVQGLKFAVEDASRSSSPGVGPIMNGVMLNSVHKRKRKRDQEIKPERAAADYIGTGNAMDVQHLPGRASGYRITSGDSPIQTGGPLKDLSGAKRPRTNRQIQGSIRKTKLYCKAAALPAALWQYIFCFVPPVFLGHLLLVNRAFKSYLTVGDKAQESATLARSIVQPLTAEAIWIASRRRFAPGLPKPIHGLQELDMWRLLVGQNCQKCGHVGDTAYPLASENPLEFGPGASGVRVVWPFGMRCCGSCLQAISKKELDLYLSTECPSFLLQAVPFALVSTDGHYIGHSLVRNQAIPTSITFTKHFPKPAIQEILRKFEDVKALGSASVEEWTKGLAGQGQEHLEDIIRWEQWELKGGLKKVNSRPHPKPVPTAIARKNISVKDDSNSDLTTLLGTVVTSSTGQANPRTALHMDSPLSVPYADMTETQDACGVTIHSIVGMHEGPQTPKYPLRPERNLRDVNGAKAARRADIERRCAALDPPLSSNVLSHMESFQAAIQITQPMTDQAWKILKPRLLAQLPYAERKERERVQQNNLLEEECRQRRHQEAQLKETKESFDREWETFQNPIRNRIGALADEIIESRWEGGRSLTKDASPCFAADVLLQVRQRFYAEIAREDEAAAAAGQILTMEPPNGPPTRTLILENMKWLFDTKIKPLTDHFQRELFLCNGCDGNLKFYGFEGVIQHYAAKHTTSLSMGNIVVHWRAEWPEHPPFSPTPTVAKTAYYKVPTPANPAQALTVADIQGTAPFGGLSQSGETGPFMVSQRHGDLQHSANTYTAPYTGNPQQGHPAIPGQPYLSQTGLGVGAGYSRATNSYASSATGHNSYASKHQSQDSQLYSSSYSSQQPIMAFVQGQPLSNPPSHFSGLPSNTYGVGQPVPYQPSFINGILPAHASNVHGPVSDLYQRQMDDMAKHAKDVFTSIGGIKDLPGSVRIYVVIQLTVFRFKANFPNEPSLSMFIDGLDHNPTMRPVRSVNGLGCKTCMSSGTGAKLFTLPHLVNHFRTVHVESPQMLGFSQVAELDWKLDMIDLPDASIISKLVHAAGMTDSKLALIASVFHRLFPSPLPNLRGKTNTGPLPTSKRESNMTFIASSKMPTKTMTDLATQHADPPTNQTRTRSGSGFRRLSRGLSSEPSEPPGEDEYDPHRPALLGHVGKLGANFRQSHKPAKSSALQNCQDSSFQQQSESSRHTFPKGINGELACADTEVTPCNTGDGYPDISHAQAQGATHFSSPGSSLFLQYRGHLGKGFEKQSMSQHPNKVKNVGVSSDYDVKPHHFHEDDRIGGNTRFAEYRERSTSPQRVADAAEQFLSSLASNGGAGYSGGLHPLNDEIERYSQAFWPQEEHQLKRHQNYFGQDGTLDHWSSNGADVNQRVIASPVNGARTGPSVLRNDSLKTTSEFHYVDEYRSPSHGQTPLELLKADERPVPRYDAQQNLIQERQETAGNALKSPRSGNHIYSQTRSSQFRLASGSPNEAPPDTALYRPRSPVEEDRRDPVYHSRSPSPLRHDRSQRVVSYEYPPEARYEYVDDHVFREPQYQQRVEYVRVPMDFEEPRPREAHTRYFVSRPVEHLEPEYVHYEQSYAGKPVFERNGQIYRASQRAYQGQPSRASFSSSFEY